MTRSADPESVRPDELPGLAQLTFRATRFGISIVDPETRILRLVNPAFAAMHGGEPEDFIGRPLDSVFTAESAALIPGLSRELQEGYISWEADHVRLDGTVFPVAIEVMTARDESTGSLYRVAWYTDLTERRRVEHERDEALRRFEAGFVNAPTGLALLDLEDRWLAINDALTALTGYTRQELSSLTFAAISHPEDAENDLEQYERLLKGELDHYTIEKRYLHKHGAVIWALASVSLVRNEDGAAAHLIVQVQDISVRKRMEEDLAHAARGFQLAQDLLCTATFDGRLDRINGSWTEVLGWTEDELRAHGFLHFVYDEDREGTMAEVAKFRDGGSSHGFRNRWVTKDGGWVWLEWSAVGIPAEDRVFCVAREVSEAVVLEQDLELQAEIVANMAEGVCLIRVADGRIEYANPRLEQMMGYEPGELNGVLAEEVMPPVDMTAEESRAAERLRARIDEEGIVTYEVRRRRKDFSTIWIRATVSTFDHPEFGQIWVLVQREITEELRARELRAELERSKDSFFSAVTHELRTPLTSILGYVAILQEDAADLGPDGAEALEIIERNASRELRLVEDLLSIASAQTEFELKFEPVDLMATVREVVAALRPACDESGLDVRLELGPPAVIRGDPDRLGQVVSNLLSNAIKFTPRGGTITVEACVADGEAVLSVADTGPGIGEKERGRVFERFYRGEHANRKKLPGAGLGLAIADSIVRAHGGVIRVRDDDGPGAVFEVSLPLGDGS